MNKFYLVSGIICTSLFTSVMSPAQAQRWSLQRCIDYAIENNIKLKQSEITAAQSKETLSQSKAALFPTLSFSTSQNMSWRPWSQSTINLTSGTMTETKSQVNYNGNYGLNANVTLWNGGKNYKTIKQNKLTQEINELSTEQTANSIQEQITQLYVQILYQAEAVKVNEEILNSSKVALERGKTMYEVGSLAKSDYLQLESQTAQENYNLVTSKSQLENFKFQLKQLLEITNSDPFDIETNEISDNSVLAPIPSKDDVYQIALEKRPEIQGSKLSLESDQLAIKIAKAGYSPTVNLNAGVSTSNASGIHKEFGTQMKQNVNTSVGLSIQVPILDQRQNKSAIRKAKLQYSNSQLALQDKEKDLYKSIENYWLEATNAQQQFKFASANVNSNKESFNLLNEKFQLGLTNIVELNNGRNSLLQAEQQYLQVKYNTLYNIAMLRFYKGENINL